MSCSMPHILFVDDDPTSRSVVAEALARPQRTIEVAAHGEEALASVARHRPDLVITDIVMPRMNGWVLVRRLRTSAATAFVPVILVSSLADAEDRIRGFRLGADDYLTKPVNLEELELRVENALHHARSRPTTNPLQGVGLAGDLRQFGVATLLTVLDMERKSGVLVLEREAESARLVMQEGRVVSAHFNKRDEPAGPSCVYELLDWSGGRFTFSEERVECSDEMGVTTASLLLEGARRMDELIRVEMD